MDALIAVKRRLRAIRPVGWAVAAVVAAGALLRFFDLGAESLWLDELTTLAQTTWGPARIVSESIVRGTPPLYYVLEKFAYGSLPASEFSLRTLSAVADAVSVYLVFAIARRLLGEWPAVVAAGFSAVAIRMIWFAQEARAYSLGMMLSLLAALTLLRLIERPSWRTSLLHLATVVAVLYTHVYSTIAVIGIELVVALSPRLWKRLGRYWGWSAIGAVLAYVPWAVALALQIGQRSQMASEGAWSIEAPRGLLRPVVTAVTDLAPGVYRNIPTSGPTGWSALAFAALVVFGLFASGSSSRAPERDSEYFALNEWERRVLLVGWAGALLVGGVVLSQHVLPIFSWRMATQAAPPLFIAAAAGLRRLWRPAAVVLVAAFMALSVAGLRPYYLDSGRGQVVEKENWRAAIEYVSENAGPGDAVLVTAHWFVGRMDLYAKMNGVELPALIGIPRDLQPFELAENVAQSTAGAQRVTVVASHASVDADGLTALDRELVAEGWQQAGAGSARGVALRVYEK